MLFPRQSEEPHLQVKFDRRTGASPYLQMFFVYTAHQGGLVLWAHPGSLGTVQDQWVWLLIIMKGCHSPLEACAYIKRRRSSYCLLANRIRRAPFRDRGFVSRATIKITREWSPGEPAHQKKLHGVCVCIGLRLIKLVQAYFNPALGAKEPALLPSNYLRLTT